MWKLIVIFGLCSSAVSETQTFRHRYEINAMRILGDRPAPHIVGGRDVTIEDHPYQVNLRFNFRHTCGGSVVNENTVLSAAHCTYGRNHANFQVLAGYTDNSIGTQTPVSQVIEHPRYDDFTLEYDVVILKLGENLVFSDRIRPIILPIPNFYVPEGRIATLTGWGALEWRGPSPTILQAVEVPVWSNNRCQAIYDEEEILDQHICAGEEGRDACQGDSGGPLVYNNMQIGVVSWGYFCAFEYPTVYARVSEFLGFILQHS